MPIPPDASTHLTTRPVRPADEQFLFELYSATRAREMALVSWSDEQKHQFLSVQFEARSRFYAEAFPDASFSIVEADGKRIGRWYVKAGDEEIRVIDIALVPARRNQGIGTALLTALFELADGTGRRVTVHVERENTTALRWYARIGFRVVRELGFYYVMERRSGSGAPMLPQPIRSREHPVLRPRNIFLMPIGPDEHGMR